MQMGIRSTLATTRKEQRGIDTNPRPVSPRSPRLSWLIAREQHSEAIPELLMGTGIVKPCEHQQEILNIFGIWAYLVKRVE